MALWRADLDWKRIGYVRLEAVAAMECVSIPGRRGASDRIPNTAAFMGRFQEAEEQRERGEVLPRVPGGVSG